MELKDFIKTTLVEISEAVQEAQTQTGLKYMLGGLPANEKDYSARIEFDIAVEVSEKANSDQSGGIGIKVVKADLAKSKENSSSSTSRIRFYVEKTKKTISHEKI